MNKGRLLSEDNAHLQDLIDRIRITLSKNTYIYGVAVPKYGIYSLLLEKIPIYVYDNENLSTSFPTAFTDGSYIFFNAEFLKDLIERDRTEGGSNILTVLVHEVNHIIFEHPHRGGRRSEHADLSDPKKAIIENCYREAEEIFTNIKTYMFFKELNTKPGSIFKLAMENPEEALKQYLHDSEHTIAYKLLASLDMNRMLSLDSLACSPDSSSCGSPQQGKDAGNSKMDQKGKSNRDVKNDALRNDEQQSSKSDGKGGRKKSKKSGQGVGGSEDEQRKSEESKKSGQGSGSSESNKQQASGNKQDSAGGGGEQQESQAPMSGDTISPTDLAKMLEQMGLGHVVEKLRIAKTQAEAKEAIDRIRSSVIEAIKKVQSCRSELGEAIGGKLPGQHIEEEYIEIIAPSKRSRLAWKAELRDAIIGSGNAWEYTECIPHILYHVDPGVLGTNVRFYDGTLIPGKPKNAVLILFDTSGSVSKEMLSDFLAEVKNLITSLHMEAPPVYVVSADTVLRGKPKFLDPDQVTEAEFENFRVSGRGGTDLANCLSKAIETISSHIKTEIGYDAKISHVLYFTDLLDTPPSRQNLPTVLPPITFICPENCYSKSFENEVSSYARVVSIVEGVTVDLDEVMSIRRGR